MNEENQLYLEEENQLYLDEINIRIILRDFIKNWWMFILIVLTALLLLSSYENLVYKEQYSSRATMVVSAKGKGTSGAYADLTITAGMADVFDDIFSSNVLRKLVAKELNVSATSFSVQASIIPETNLLIVQVTGEDPRIVHQAIGEVLDNKKGHEIRVLHVEDKTVIAEYFVICTGNSSTQVKALAGEVEYRLEQRGIAPYSVEGRDNNSWVVVDFSNVIVHVFSREAREFYKLDKLYED